MTTKVKWRGVILDKRTAEQMAEVARLAPVRIQPTQGSYNKGGVAASAGTHDGGGAIDLHIDGYSNNDIVAIVRIMREVGFAAWHRTALPGIWGQHIHAISVGCPDLAPLARAQVEDLRHGRNGLRGHAKDPQAFLKVKVTTWEAYKAAKLRKAHKTPAAAVVAAGVGAAVVGGVTNPPVKTPTHVVVPKPPAKHRAPGPAKTVTLSKTTKPGKHGAQNVLLNQLLVKEGYGPVSTLKDFYGPGTQGAVVRFHHKHPEFASGSRDKVIGTRGWVYLQTHAK